MKMIRVIKSAINSKEAYEIIMREKISQEDPRYNEFIKAAIKEANLAYTLISVGVIKPDDIYYNAALKKVAKDNIRLLTYLIANQKVNKNNPIIQESVPQAIKNKTEDIYLLLTQGVIDKNSKYWNEIVSQSIMNAWSAYKLIDEKILTPKDVQFNQALETLFNSKNIENVRDWIVSLFISNKIPKDNPYYNKLKEYINSTIISQEEQVDLSPSNFSNYLSECEPEELELACRALRLTPKQITGEDVDWDGVYVDDMIEALHNKATTDKLKVKVMKVIEEDRQ